MSETVKFGDDSQPTRSFNQGDYREPLESLGALPTPGLVDFQNIFLTIAGGNYAEGLDYDLTEQADQQFGQLSLFDVQAFLRRLYANHIEDDERLAMYEAELNSGYDVSPSTFLHVLKGSFGPVTWKDIRGVGEERAKMGRVHYQTKISAGVKDVNQFLIFFKKGEREYVEVDSEYTNPKETRFMIRAAEYTPVDPESDDYELGIHGELHIRGGENIPPTWVMTIHLPPNY